ncbi:MAG: divergent polysaccharide deacetylase family protein [Pseudomonadota bacterium]|nr:divergent polysaccharide deacetylase family protein [Pseudomonadota bacterium]MEC9235373.1 divergent polysaccharide deacetylase family protein [Pseudomonadota bacterium]MEE3322345.1 divergent polysaccharide deacetylase family protein [Pseudomonadota bacterium]
MPPRLKKTAKGRKQPETQNELKEVIVSLGASISFKLFSLSLIGGAAALFSICAAIIMTAPATDTSNWPYAEVKIIAPNEVTLEHSEDTAALEHGEQITEYGAAHDTTYKIDLSHDMSLYDTIDNGVIVPRRNGARTVFKAYSTPLFDDLKDTPYKGIVALVMTDYGLSQQRTTQAETVFKDIHINYALNPYTANAQGIIDSARTNGHEIWMDVPLEPDNFPLTESGPLTMLIRSKADENRRRLIWLLSIAKGFPGLIQTQKTDFVNADTEMFNLLTALHEHGLGFASSVVQDGSLVGHAAQQAKVPFAQNNIWLGRSGRLDDLKQDIQKLESMALKNENAMVAFFPPHPSFIEHIGKWVENVRKEHNVIFVPLSYTIKNTY